METVKVEDIENLLNLVFEDQRFESFKEWPYSDKQKCSKRAMAEAGFHWTGKDSAKCFVCDKELDGWEADDNPWHEHSKHAPQCPFIKLNKKQSELTVNEFLSLMHEFGKKTIRNKYELHAYNIKKLFNKQIEVIKDTML